LDYEFSDSLLETAVACSRARFPSCPARRDDAHGSGLSHPASSSHKALLVIAGT
jgi:DNA-binding sugar fermentation-stimulating protein